MKLFSNKKIICAFLITTTMLSFAACGNDGGLQEWCMAG